MGANDELRKAIIKRLQQANVGQVLASIAQNRIQTKGADIGGYAELWANKARIEVTRKKRGKVIKEEIKHYRAGGTPLYDTGNLFRSLRGVTTPTSDGVALTLQGSLIAVLQNKGFKTSGPNWIPFSRKAIKQQAARGQKSKGRSRSNFVTSNPDGLVVARGVTVPARPLFAWPASAERTLARALARAMHAR